MKKVISISLFTIIVLSLHISVASANEDSGKKRGMFGFKIGQYGSGTVNVTNKDIGAESEYDTDAGTTFGLFLDYPLTSQLYAGVSFDITNLDFGREEEKLLNAGFTVKYALTNKNSQLMVRPVIQIGYGMLPEVLVKGSSTYITLLVSNEAILKTAEKFGLTADIGLFWALSGGNNDYDVTGGPMLILRAGVVFL